ncbi:hypothetical protein [Corynebacterium kalidii]
MSTLGQRLAELNDSLTPAEQANYKLILGLSAGHLAQENSVGESRQTVTDTLHQLCPYEVDKVEGLQYRGRPDFMTDELLHKLQNEARSLESDAIPYDEHYLGYGGSVADQVAVSNELTEMVTAIVPKSAPTGIASYLFYRDPGQGIIPHVDTDIFSLNILLMLEHQTVEGDPEPSALTLHYPDGTTEAVDLEAGEIAVFLAGTQAHSRTPIKSGEKVSILTFGFMPEGAPIENYRR